MVYSSPGTIIVAISRPNTTFLPLNCSRAKANAESTVTIRDNTVDIVPTSSVCRNRSLRFAWLNAVAKFWKNSLCGHSVGTLARYSSIVFRDEMTIQ